MRKGLTLSTRLAILVVSTVVLTAIGVGYLGYRNIAPVAVERTLGAINANAGWQARELSHLVGGAAADLLGFRHIIGIDDLIELSADPSKTEAGGVSLPVWRGRIGRRLALELENKPDFMRYRLIGLADQSRDIVRVEREPDGNVRIVPDSDLAFMNARAFQFGLTARDGETLISGVEFEPIDPKADKNAQHDASQLRPIIRVVTPVFASNGQRFGILTATIDLRRPFQRLNNPVLPSSKIYVVDRRGHYLFHPDAPHGIAASIPSSVKLEFPALAEALDSGRWTPAVIPNRHGDRFGVALQPMRIDDETPLALVEVIPEQDMIRSPMLVWAKSTLIGGSFAVLVAIILSVSFARGLARPLADMTRAVTSLGSGAPLALPRNASGEIGILVEAFSATIREARDKTAALRREKEIFESITTAMAEAVLLIDTNASVLYENPAAMALRTSSTGITGPNWERSIEMFMTDGVTPLPIAQRPGRRALTGELVDRFELVVHVLGSDKYVDVSGNARPIRDADGAISGAVLVFTDVSELKETERRLHQAQKLEAIGQLTGGVAHDFNNMLTVISGTAEILLDELADRPDLVTIAKMIDQAAERGADLTRQLLAFARKQPLQPRSIDVNTVVSNIKQLLRPTIGEHIAIDMQLAPDIDPALIDPSQLSSALLNLAVNSRDAMPDGGKLLFETANVTLDDDYAEHHPEVRPGRYVMIAVSDSGVGMTPEVLEKAFEPFFTTKIVGKGTGLGLSMVYGFVKQSNGHIQIYSEEQHGTTIRLYLPRAESSADVLPPAAPIEGGTETILLVEDDELVRNFALVQLRGLGYRTIAAEDGAAALAEVKRGTPFDLLLTDIIMPGGMNGRELADAVARLRPVKVLYTSGYTENAIVHHGRLDPGVLLLSKPFRRADLARLVRTALTRGDHRPPNDSASTRRKSAAS
ncbi:hybrid sensor histidine kinase/response regulator [Rhodopseudomonas palustris]|uniref:histidine kinase n=1 Tax=Rhodopseudomonas palustris TaxID=1076 RepID=A0A323UJN1_RHOPL|nr:ATP-binding protein [Rhodopseudomonas palustris]PZA13322.1 hybrid sensor histidine kinase/response regulator [Rhodopseudomonas palustris]